MTPDFPLDAAPESAAFWDRLAQRAAAWLESQELSPRDAVLLLPFAQHLAPARRAWMKLSRWQPRIETTHSLASALGPSPLPQAQQLSFDAAIDALAAWALLREQSWAQALRQEDPRAFEAALQRLVEAAHALARAAQLRSPQARLEFWALARQTVAAQSGAGHLERALLMVAIEWAAADPREPATDALFQLRPSAWLHLQSGGPDALADALLCEAAAAGVPCLRLNADLSLDAVFADAPPQARLEQTVCDDFEDLAQCSAASVLDHLRAGRAPVALIAQDRVLIRRVRALLERQAVGIADETGWTLATTAPAAQLMAMLRATRREATVDEWLAWLKTPLAASLRERAGGGALSALESRCRNRGWSSPQAVHPERLTPGSARLWTSSREALQPLQAGTARSLEDWLKALAEVLDQLGADEQLDRQPAGGPQLLDALWLRRSPWPGSAHEAVWRDSQLSASEFVAWVSATLEAAQYVPPLQGELQVMITPLARAMLRPFGAVVLPGADAATLGPVPPGPVLIGDSLARQLGLPTVEDKRSAIAWQFAQLLRAPALTLLRCGHHGSEPLAASPLLERLDLALQNGGHGRLPLWHDPRIEVAVPVQTHTRAQAQAQGRLPRALSASAVESLRQCPYQFFARVLLGLRESSELEVQADKRDYGTWLHEVLHQFHRERLEGIDPELDDPARLARAGEAQMQALGLSAAEFLPFSASFARFAPTYLLWLAEQESKGQQFAAGELDRVVHPWAPVEPALAGLALRGRLDRVDDSPQGRWLLDYKTGSVKSLKDKVADPLEDTQLAVYAVLMGAEDGRPVRAEYLALDDAKGPVAIEHEDVETTASVMLDGLGEDLMAIRRGDPLPALGEGVACDYCEMRGLCRRDDWEGAAP
ncbi:PD-(D/E)XK nuclease family protein [Roseateles amylovorans]|uniref:PD-(D/E)XK nuclease family protein n=1 Tax=Roseateles amylovorans TaxID=2978473 RepID=A0ABY6AZC2_9BURK|nr:PD-(D/E)XK nuclease family protein [Roseateles amylovorans]UXH76430.1 PD-(D/E)XK nuclease family protein [Roseateles amylovorans]